MLKDVKSGVWERHDEFTVLKDGGAAATANGAAAGPPSLAASVVMDPSLQGTALFHSAAANRHLRKRTTVVPCRAQVSCAPAHLPLWLVLEDDNNKPKGAETARAQKSSSPQSKGASHKRTLIGTFGTSERMSDLINPFISRLPAPPATARLPTRPTHQGGAMMLSPKDFASSVRREPSLSTAPQGTCSMTEFSGSFRPLPTKSTAAAVGEDPSPQAASSPHRRRHSIGVGQKAANEAKAATAKICRVLDDFEKRVEHEYPQEDSRHSPIERNAMGGMVGSLRLNNKHALPSPPPRAAFRDPGHHPIIGLCCSRPFSDIAAIYSRFCKAHVPPPSLIIQARLRAPKLLSVGNVTSQVWEDAAALTWDGSLGSDDTEIMRKNEAGFYFFVHPDGLNAHQFELFLRDVVPHMSISSEYSSELYVSLLKEGTKKLHISTIADIVNSALQPSHVKQNVDFFLQCFDPHNVGRVPHFIFYPRFVEKYIAKHVWSGVVQQWGMLVGTLKRLHENKDEDPTFTWMLDSFLKYGCLASSPIVTGRVNVLPGSLGAPMAALTAGNSGVIAITHAEARFIIYGTSSLRSCFAQNSFAFLMPSSLESGEGARNISAQPPSREPLTHLPPIKLLEGSAGPT